MHFSATANPSDRERYDATIPIIDKAIADALAVAPAGTANDVLVALETEAMNLAAKGETSRATAIIQSAEYAKYKAILAEGTATLLAAIDSELKTELEQRKREAWLFVLALLGGTGFGVLLLWRRMNRALAASEKAFLDMDAKIRGELETANNENIRNLRMVQLGQLTATIAHEIRNPLWVVRTSALVLQRKIKDKDPETSKVFDRITKGIVRCDDIIAQLHDFSRISALRLQISEFDDWVAETLEDIASTLPPDVTVEAHLGLAGQQAAFDQERMRRVLVNLAHNASEAMVGKGDQKRDACRPAPQVIVSTN